MSSTVDSSSSAGKVSGRKFVRELKLAKTLGIVILCFVVCWLPFEIINIMILVDEGLANCNVEIADSDLLARIHELFFKSSSLCF